MARDFSFTIALILAGLLITFACIGVFKLFIN